MKFRVVAPFFQHPYHRDEFYLAGDVILVDNATPMAFMNNNPGAFVPATGDPDVTAPRTLAAIESHFDTEYGG